MNARLSKLRDRLPSTLRLCCEPHGTVGPDLVINSAINGTLRIELTK